MNCMAALVPPPASLPSPPSPPGPLFSASFCHHFVATCHQGPFQVVVRVECAQVSAKRPRCQHRLPPRRPKRLTGRQDQQVVFHCFPLLPDSATEETAREARGLCFRLTGSVRGLKRAYQLCCPSAQPSAIHQQKEPKKQILEASQPMCGEGQAPVSPGWFSRETCREERSPSRPRHRKSRQTAAQKHPSGQAEAREPWRRGREVSLHKRH